MNLSSAIKMLTRRTIFKVLYQVIFGVYNTELEGNSALYMKQLCSHT